MSKQIQVLIEMTEIFCDYITFVFVIGSLLVFDLLLFVLLRSVRFNDRFTGQVGRLIGSVLG